MSTAQHTPLDIAAIRARLASTRGKQYWKSLEELAGSPEFEEMLHREFPRQASEWGGGLDRRSFLKLMGASLALAGLSSCGRQPDETIVPYVRTPEGMVPGKPLMFASAITQDGYAMGTLVRSDMGRPTKIEGNPLHPASLGATDLFTQSSILTLYDPDRSQELLYRGNVSGWETFFDRLKPMLDAQRALRGSGLRILSGTITSPTLSDQLHQLLGQFPEARWCQYDAAGRDSARQGAVMAFGQAVSVRYRPGEADVVLSLDADFLNHGPAALRHARELAARRDPSRNAGKMSRLYVAETTPTPTGTLADHRLPVRASAVELLARSLAAALGVRGAVPAGALTEKEEHWIRTVARDLQQHGAAALVIPGDHQPAVVHAITHLVNHALGNIGRTVEYADPVEADAGQQAAALPDLVSDMRAGKVDMLLILGGNPVYDAPADLDMAGALAAVGTVIRLGLYDDETSSYAHWHIPEAHPLEAWSDARAFDGTVTIMQPLIAPLFNGRSAHELLAACLGQPATGYDLIRAAWMQRQGAAGFEEFWRSSLNNGVVDKSALPSRAVAPRADMSAWSAPAAPDRQGLEIVFRPDPTIHDGRFANNGWLQELPKPVSKLTWDNAAFVAPATAERLSVSTGDLVELQYAGRTLRAPVCILPGQAEGAVTVHLGYGRTRSGKIGTGIGFSAGRLRTSDRPWFGVGLAVNRTGERYPLSTTQEHFTMEGRAPARFGTLEEFSRDPEFARKEVEAPKREETLYPEYDYDSHAWGMAIDLNACTGCSACVVACQAENNIPIVGKEQVAMSREMHWLAIDQYYVGGLDNPAVVNQPRACVHCETAPCEVVCPVGATVHDHEGLNAMVYNRCVGTRYCSNNCPYKVRRFNFLQYTDTDSPTLAMQRNPDVTVRSRGVMEKCTYCVQRISAARIEAKKENRPIRDGEIVTACQAACPTQAIVFGDLNDKNSAVRRKKADPRDYGLLAELNTRPRTTYQAKITNPNPELKETSDRS